MFIEFCMPVTWNSGRLTSDTDSGPLGLHTRVPYMVKPTVR